MSYNGWSNRETWVVRMWFGDDWTRKSDVDDTMAYIEEELDRVSKDMPGWMTDLLSLDWDVREVDVDELKDSIESDDDDDDDV
jgi:hypothetical protein